MRAKDIMTTPVVTVTRDTHIKDAAALMVERAISAMPVVDEAGDLVGIVSEADLIPLELTPDPRSHILPTPRRHGPVPRTVGEVMTTRVVALQESADVAEVARLMLRAQVKRIPIVSDARVIGIVSRRDVLKVLARSDAEIVAELRELLDEEIEMLGRFVAEVEDGVVTLTGPDERPSRRLAELLARSVAGVIDVQFRDAPPET
jgi:CBS domain-containing protein